MADVTQILSQIEQGDRRAAEELLPLVYDELRRLAASRLAQEKPGQTLQATALVHEAYLRLVPPAPSDREDRNRRRTVDGDSKSAVAADCPWNSRGHFFAAAAEAMRRILVEAARRKRRARHGGGLRRVDLDAQAAVIDNDDLDLATLDELLERLEQEEPAAAAVVKLRYFAGLTIEETALALDISVRTANRHWAYARAWLYQRMS